MSAPDITALITDLGSKRGAVRRAAREQLVGLAPAVVAALTRALRDGDHNTRWGAAKALGQIADPTSAPVLVEALEDDESDVRWLAAVALVALRRVGLVALLEAIRDDKLDLWSHHAAHHVLIDLADLPDLGLRDELMPLIDAIEGDSPGVVAPLAAARLLEG